MPQGSATSKAPYRFPHETPSTAGIQRNWLDIIINPAPLDGHRPVIVGKHATLWRNSVWWVESARMDEDHLVTGEAVGLENVLEDAQQDGINQSRTELFVDLPDHRLERGLAELHATTDEPVEALGVLARCRQS